MTVSSQVSNARKQKGMTQEELADRAQITVRTIQRVESGESSPRAYTLKLIAAALEIPFEEFGKTAQNKETRDLKVILTDTIDEDRHFLNMVGLSCFTFIVIPYVHFLFSYRIIKKCTGISPQAKKLAQNWVSKQIWWVVVFHSSLLIVLAYNIIQSNYGNKQYTVGYLWLVMLMYLFNAFLITNALLKSRHFTRQ